MNLAQLYLRCSNQTDMELIQPYLKEIKNLIQQGKTCDVFVPSHLVDMIEDFIDGQDDGLTYGYCVRVSNDALAISPSIFQLAAHERSR